MLNVCRALDLELTKIKSSMKAKALKPLHFIICVIMSATN